MNSERERPYETLSEEELRQELKRLKDNLCDLEDTHSFTFGSLQHHKGTITKLVYCLWRQPKGIEAFF